MRIVGAAGLTPALDGIHPFNSDVVMSFTSDPRTFTISRFSNGYTYVSSGGQGFALADPGGAYSKVVSPGETDKFLLGQLTIGSGVPLDYVRYTVSTLQIAAVQYCALGVTTALTDFPTAPTVDFTTFALRGIAYDRSSGSLLLYSLEQSGMQFSVDQVSSTVGVTMHLVGNSGSGGTKDFGTFSGTAPLNGITGGYAGTLDSTPNSVTAQFSGAFFGSQAKEFGFAFNLGRMAGSPSDYDLVIIGTAQGTR